MIQEGGVAPPAAAAASLVGIVLGAEPIALILADGRISAVSIGQSSPVGVLVSARDGRAVFRKDGRLITLVVGGAP
jgi:hypothetical protein